MNNNVCITNNAYGQTVDTKMCLEPVCLKVVISPNYSWNYLKTPKVCASHSFCSVSKLRWNNCLLTASSLLLYTGVLSLTARVITQGAIHCLSDWITLLANDEIQREAENGFIEYYYKCVYFYKWNFRSKDKLYPWPGMNTYIHSYMNISDCWIHAGYKTGH